MIRSHHDACIASLVSKHVCHINFKPLSTFFFIGKLHTHTNQMGFEPITSASTHTCENWKSNLGSSHHI